MNPLEDMQLRLSKQFPTGAFHIDRPKYEDGTWDLDISYEGRSFVATYRTPDHYSVSLLGEDVGYGEGPDEVLTDPEATYLRLVQLLTG